MRAWGPVSALVFALVLALVTGVRVDAARAGMVFGVIIGVVVTLTLVALLLVGMWIAHARAVVSSAEEGRSTVIVVREETGGNLARKPEANEVVVMGSDGT